MPSTIWFDAKRPDGSCPPIEFDIAGPGVVLSFVIAGFITLVAVTFSVWCDTVLGDKSGVCFPSFSSHAKKPLSETRKQSILFWRSLFDRIVVSYADQQIITGISLLVCGWVKWHDAAGLQSAHFKLVIFLCNVCASSHLACILVLRRRHLRYKTAAKIRIVPIYLFGIGLVSSVIKSSSSYTASGIRSYNNAFVFGWVFFFLSYIMTGPLVELVIGLLDNIILRPNRQTKSRFAIVYERVTFHIKDSIDRISWLSFIILVVFNWTSTVYAMMQKFGSAPDDMHCALNSGNSDQWGFGQILSLLLLVLPLYAALETFFELRKDREYNVSSDAQEHILTGAGTEAGGDEIELETSPEAEQQHGSSTEIARPTSSGEVTLSGDAEEDSISIPSPKRVDTEQSIGFDSGKTSALPEADVIARLP